MNQTFCGSLFLNSENLFYYARDPLSSAKPLSIEEIQALLAPSQIARAAPTMQLTVINEREETHGDTFKESGTNIVPEDKDGVILKGEHKGASDGRDGERHDEKDVMVHVRSNDKIAKLEQEGDESEKRPDQGTEETHPSLKQTVIPESNETPEVLSQGKTPTCSPAKSDRILVSLSVVEVNNYFEEIFVKIIFQYSFLINNDSLNMQIRHISLCLHLHNQKMFVKKMSVKKLMEKKHIHHLNKL